MLEKLIESGVCFAVVIAQSSFKVRHVEFGGRDTFILIAAKDKIEGFEESETIPDTMEHDMSPEDLEYFKTVSEKLFTKVLHDSDGRVYELKDNSFVEYMKTIRKDEKNTASAS